MKRFLKTVAFLLVTVLAVSLFAACGEETPGTQSTNNGGNSVGGNSAGGGSTEIAMTFDLNYEGAPAATVVKANAKGFIE